MQDPLNVHNGISSMDHKSIKKPEEMTKKKLEHEKTREDIKEQSHQMDLQKNYESDEKFDESTE